MFLFLPGRLEGRCVWLAQSHAKCMLGMLYIGFILDGRVFCNLLA